MSSYKNKNKQLRSKKKHVIVSLSIYSWQSVTNGIDWLFVFCELSSCVFVCGG